MALRSSLLYPMPSRRQFLNHLERHELIALTSRFYRLLLRSNLRATIDSVQNAVHKASDGAEINAHRYGLRLAKMNLAARPLGGAATGRHLSRA